MLALTVAELENFLEEEFPQIAPMGVQILEITERRIAVRLPASAANLRPGGTISGPAMMSLTDVAMYLMVLAHIGPEALAVTTSVTMNFLRRPPPGDLVAHGDLLKLGRRLAVGHFLLRGEDHGELVADASLTYSIPPRRR